MLEGSCPDTRAAYGRLTRLISAGRMQTLAGEWQDKGVCEIDLALLAEEIGRGIGVNVNGISSKERRFLNRRWSALVCDAT